MSSQLNYLREQTYGILGEHKKVLDTHNSSIYNIQQVNLDQTNAITTNAKNIATNTSNITTNAQNINTNVQTLGHHQTSISTNASNIGKLQNAIPDPTKYQMYGLIMVDTAASAFTVDLFTLSTGQKLYCKGTLASWGNAANATSGGSQYNFLFTIVCNSLGALYLIKNVDPKITTTNSVSSVDIVMSGNTVSLSVTPGAALEYNCLFEARTEGTVAPIFTSSSTSVTLTQY